MTGASFFIDVVLVIRSKDKVDITFDILACPSYTELIFLALADIAP